MLEAFQGQTIAVLYTREISESVGSCANLNLFVVANVRMDKKEWLCLLNKVEGQESYLPANSNVRACSLCCWHEMFCPSRPWVHIDIILDGCRRTRRFHLTCQSSVQLHRFSFILFRSINSVHLSDVEQSCSRTERVCFVFKKLCLGHAHCSCLVDIFALSEPVVKEEALAYFRSIELI